MIVVEILVVWAALSIAVYVLLVVPSRAARAARRHTERLAAARRARRIDADRRIVEGREPLPPGVTLDEAYRLAADQGVPLADAAFAIHRARTLAVIRKAVRHPRPGD